MSGAEEAFPATPHAAPPTAQNESDAPLRVVQTDAYFCLSLQRVDATRLVFTYARPIACSMQDAADLLRAVGALLRARLDDLFEVDAVRAERTHLDRRVSELSLLFKSIDVVLSAVELPKVMRAFMTCVTAGEAIGFNRAFLFLLDEQHNDLRGALAVGPSGRRPARRRAASGIVCVMKTFRSKRR